MSEENIWIEKIAEQFHDPFIKAWCQGKTAKEISRNIGAMIEFIKEDPNTNMDINELVEKWTQDSITAMLSKMLLGDSFVFPEKYRNRKQGERLSIAMDSDTISSHLQPDLAASGADRPVLGTYHQNYVKFWDIGKKQVTITHPLDFAHLSIPTPDTIDLLWKKLIPAIDTLNEFAKELNGKFRFRDAFYYMWRRLPDELSKIDGQFWPLQPADTRCPDHSIWDHLRISSALYFIPKVKTADENVRGKNIKKRPWLMSLWVGPHKDFINHSRTGRDLWTGSMMLSELAWSMMEPIIEKIGADNILYPDLRGNHRCDVWLKKKRIIFDSESLTGTLSSLIPNRVVAVVPEEMVDEFGTICIRSVKNRWMKMVEEVRNYLMHPKRLGTGPWIEIFNRQTDQGPLSNWIATEWKWDGYKGSYKAKDIKLPPVFPFQDRPEKLPKPIQDIEKKRFQRFNDWIDFETWNHYQAVRYTFLQTHPGYLMNQRGFDYSLTHHKLLTLHSARKNMGNLVQENEMPGDKCTLCGEKQALTNNSHGPVGRQRDEATRLWRKMDPEHIGHERLCGICAVRRYLSESNDEIKLNWSDVSHFKLTKAGPEIPFPSTGLIAAQDWLSIVCRKYDQNEGNIRFVVANIVETFKTIGIKESQFVGSLARFRNMINKCSSPTLQSFLRIEIQYLNPEYWIPSTSDSSMIKELYCEMKRHCTDLLKIAGIPNNHIAVIKLDGDQMGELLLGSPQRVAAEWKEVLHPDAVKNILSSKISETDVPNWKESWRTLLHEKRTMGPSIHALISRSLREFSNRILPWVVEHQYNGRLIYSGGDDALILCQAKDAIRLIKTLNDLYSSAWVKDKHPDVSAWNFGNEDTAKLKHFENRFVSNVSDLERTSGYIFPMLGKNSTFSAGVSYGHFKTSLRQLLIEAEAGLRRAKDLGRKRTSLSWFTRNGVKRQWVGLINAVESECNIMDIEKLVELFDKKIPRGLPYKLAEKEHQAKAILENNIKDSGPILDQFVRDSMDFGTEYSDLVMRIWREGLIAKSTTQYVRESVTGLLFSRDLSAIINLSNNEEINEPG